MRLVVARIRMLVALLALFAFGSAGAAGAWALASADATTVAMCVDQVGGDCGHRSHDSGPSTDPCPSMPAGLTGACAMVAAALPAGSLAAVPLAASSQRPPSASDEVPALLLTQGLFRPPRA